MAITTLPTAKLRAYAEYELLGVVIESRPARVVAVRIRSAGFGLESRFEILAGAQSELPADVSELLEQLATGSLTSTELALLSTSLTAAAVSLSHELLVDASSALPLALGITDPGVWQITAGEVHGYSSLCDAAALAEGTGISVVDAFPARDLALGGRGGPLDGLPLWLWLHDARRARLVVDLRDVVRLTYLPASCEASGASRVATFELNYPGDPVEFDQTAWQQVAEDILKAVAERVPRRPPLGQLVFAQESVGSEMLRPRLIEQLADVSHVTVKELGVQPDWLSAACTTGLAMLHVEQIPTGGILQTGASAARVLGRLTPGTPHNWRRLLKLLAEHQPTTMSLRSAM
jgi:1,6-anhydro-N-acetylmuramate kinase